MNKQQEQKERKNELIRLRNELWYIKASVSKDPRVIDLENKLQDMRKQVKEELKPKTEPINNKIKLLEQEIEDNKPKKKPRIPEDCPQEVIDTCDNYWRGSEEYRTYRIHEWNDKAVWTSYPAGGYSTNGGWVSAQACFFLLSRTETDGYSKHVPKTLQDKEGRTSKKFMKEELDKL